MARRKDKDWNCGEENGTASFDQAKLATLMDLRDELKQLNRVFACGNFTRMPQDIHRMAIALEQLNRRLAKKIPLRAL